jgi:hypothetical protein
MAVPVAQLNEGSGKVCVDQETHALVYATGKA